MNTIQFTNPTGANPAIVASGTTTDIDIPITPQGSGSVTTPKARIDNLTAGAQTVTGVTDGSAAAAGIIGEVKSSLVATGGAQSMADGTAKNITTLTLTAGDWDVEGNVNINFGSATTTASSAGISLTTAAVPTDGSEVANGMQLTTTTAVTGITLPRKVINVTTDTTVYLVGKAAFSAGTCAGWGSITARRVR